MGQQNTCINRSSGVNNHSGLTPQKMARYEFFKEQRIAESWFIWIISVVEFPIMILTLFALCVLIKSQRSAPVFVLHLILSDLIQIICMVMMTVDQFKFSPELDSAYWYSLIVGLYFMACIAVERYLLVSHPIWYKSHQSLKVSSVISVIIWFVPLIFANLNCDLLFTNLDESIACLIPYPIILLCFVGTFHGLSRAISLTPLKRKLILGSLFLVLVTYTFLILPFVVLNFMKERFWQNLSFVEAFFYFDTLLYLNPLADCLLYLFMRPDVGDLLKSVHCCCRTDTHHSQDRSGTFACSASHSRTACTSV